MASEVTLLPQPDSPTSPSVAPLATLRSTLSTAWVVRPSSPWKIDAQALDFDQRGLPSFLDPQSPLRSLASMVARSVMPAGLLRLGRNWRKCTQRSRLTCSRRSSSASGSAWSSTRRSRSDHSSLAVDQKRRRLLAALVAARGFARPHRRDQALRERQRFVRHVGLRRIVEHARARPACCRQWKSRRPRCVRTSRRIRCRYGRRCGRRRP